MHRVSSHGPWGLKALSPLDAHDLSTSWGRIKYSHHQNALCCRRLGCDDMSVAVLASSDARIFSRISRCCRSSHTIYMRSSSLSESIMQPSPSSAPLTNSKLVVHPHPPCSLMACAPQPSGCPTDPHAESLGPTIDCSVKLALTHVASVLAVAHITMNSLMMLSATCW